MLKKNHHIMHDSANDGMFVYSGKTKLMFGSVTMLKIKFQ